MEQIQKTQEGADSVKRLVSTLGIEKPEWLEYRRKGIGGSDAGAVCGLNPYRTAMQVYQDKIMDDLDEFDTNFFTLSSPSCVFCICSISLTVPRSGST